MPKKICVSHTGLNNKQKKELEVRVKKTVEEYNKELKELAETTETEAEEQTESQEETKE